MVYIMMGVSIFVGFCFFTGYLVGDSSILYKVGVLLERNIWGAVLFLAAGLAEYGMIFKQRMAIVYGSLIGFMVWLFACISLVLEHEWYVFVTFTAFHLVFHGYVYLASSLNILEREPVQSFELKD
jgi:hypothetical protein